MTHMVDPLSTLRPLREDGIEHRATGQVSSGTAPLAYDVYRSGNQLIIEFDAPGVAPSDIAVRVEGRADRCKPAACLEPGAGNRRDRGGPPARHVPPALVARGPVGPRGAGGRSGARRADHPGPARRRHRQPHGRGDAGSDAPWGIVAGCGSRGPVGSEPRRSRSARRSGHGGPQRRMSERRAGDADACHLYARASL